MNPTAEAVGRFYDQWTPLLWSAAGTTFQGGLIQREAGEPVTPASSNRFLAELAGVKRGDRVLDAGCGVGGPACDIAAALPGVVIDGITNSAVQASIGRRHIAAAELRHRVAIHLGDFHELPFRGDTFDVVLFLEVTGYSPDRAVLYEEAARVLKPGGTVYVKDLFRRAGTLTAEQRAAMRNFDTLWGCVGSPTLPDTVAAMTAAGLTDVTTREYPHVDMEHYYRSMTAPGGGLNAFGEAFLHRDRIDVSAGLPVLFGEARARKPVGEPPPGGNIVGY